LPPPAWTFPRPLALLVLLVRAGALGDLLLLRPAIAALRARGHLVTLLAPSAPAAALLGPDGVEAILPWDGAETAAILGGEATHGPVADALQAADVVVAFTRSTPALAALRMRARRLVPRDPAPPAGGPHASRWLAGALKHLGIDSLPEPSPFRFTESEHGEAAALTASLPTGFLAVHPGSGSPAKNWPLDRFTATAGRLSPGRPWLLVLGPAEHDVIAPAGAVVARGWPLRTLGAALARAGLFLGNDSGVAHIAAACGTRTLALFGPTDPAQWAPVGRFVATLRAPTGRVADLEIDEVLAAAEELDRSAGSPERPGAGLPVPGASTGC
jgi:heptosyltransferase-3